MLLIKIYIKTSFINDFQLLVIKIHCAMKFENKKIFKILFGKLNLINETEFTAILGEFKKSHFPKNGEKHSSFHIFVSNL